VKEEGDGESPTWGRHSHLTLSRNKKWGGKKVGTGRRAQQQRGDEKILYERFPQENLKEREQSNLQIEADRKSPSRQEKTKSQPAGLEKKAIFPLPSQSQGDDKALRPGETRESTAERIRIHRKDNFNRNLEGKILDLIRFQGQSAQDDQEGFPTATNRKSPTA